LCCGKGLTVHKVLTGAPLWITGKDMEHIADQLRGAGQNLRQIKCILQSLRSLPQSIGELAKANDCDLMQWSASHAKSYVTYARRGLRILFTDAEQRWPGFYRYKRQARRFNRDRVLAELNGIKGLNPALVDVDIIIRAMKQGSCREISECPTLLMTCWCTAFDRFPLVPPRVRAMMLLRWAGDGDILEVFRCMAQSSVDHGGRNKLLELLNCFYQLCVLLQPFGKVSDRIRAVDRADILKLVEDRGSNLLKRHISVLFFQFRRGGRWKGFILPWQEFPQISPREVGYKAKRMRRTRKSLTWEELGRLFDITKDNARDDALLRYYIHTSRRRASACELLVDDVWDAVADAPRTTGVVLDKFNTHVAFPIDEILGQALARWIRTSGVNRYVFPSSYGVDRMWPYDSVNKWFRGVANRAGIFGDHVFVHGLRHTVATLLHQSGNKIEDISTYLGHRSVTTTQIYIDRSVSRPQDRMAIPWLTRSAELAGLRLSGATISGITREMDCPMAPDSTSGSSSTATTTLGSVMMDASEQQQALVAALTRQLAQRDAEAHRHTELYNFLVGQVLTDVQRLKLGEWQREHPVSGDPVDAAPSWQETLARNYADLDGENSDDDSDACGGDSDALNDECHAPDDE
jgi:integrase